MGIFKKKDLLNEDVQKAESESISSIIDKNMVIDGEISFQGKAKIDGVVVGNVGGEHLILSSTGKITGSVSVTSFNCYGMQQGDVNANIITARKGCSIHGRLETGSLMVEPGAVLVGEIKAALKDFTAIAARTINILTQESLPDDTPAEQQALPEFCKKTDAKGNGAVQPIQKNTAQGKR